jgi:hypothetical protein
MRDIETDYPVSMSPVENAMLARLLRESTTLQDDSIRQHLIDWGILWSGVAQRQLRTSGWHFLTAAVCGFLIWVYASRGDWFWLVTALNATFLCYRGCRFRKLGRVLLAHASAAFHMAGAGHEEGR